MTKIIFQITILLTLFQSCIGQTGNSALYTTNYIDSIQNAKQIADLISKIDDKYGNFTLSFSLKFTDKKYQNLCDSLKIQPWAKAITD